MIDEIIAVYRYREMLKTTVGRELRAKYKGSALGFLWTFVNPLLQLMVFSFVFRVVMRFSVPGYSYTVFLFVGLVPWMNFSTGLLMSTSTFVSNANMLKKVYFPRIILPVASVTSNLVNMLLSMAIVFPVLWLSGSLPTWHYVFFPLIFTIQALMMLGIGLFLATLNVYFRDLEHIFNIITMAWFYVTPILYTPDMVQSQLYHWFKLNPIFPIINSYRDVLMFGRTPDFPGLAYSAAIGITAVVLGYLVYEALQRRFAEEL